MRGEQTCPARTLERLTPLSAPRAPWIAAAHSSSRRPPRWHGQVERITRIVALGRRCTRSGVAVSDPWHCPGQASRLPLGFDGGLDHYGLIGPTGPLAYPVLPIGRPGSVPPTVHEPSATPYRAKAAQPPTPVVRANESRLASDASRSRIRLNLKPGQKGTRELLEQYGNRLICVRYRYDPRRKKRFKTVGIVVDERDWAPPASAFAYDQIVAVRVAFEEAVIREQVKQAGGTWNRPRRVWELAYGKAIALGLSDRVVRERASTRGCQAPGAKHLPVDAREASR